MKTLTLRVRNVVDATRFWVHGCEPGRVSDGSRLALCQTLSIECPSSIFFWPVYFVIPVPFSLSFFCVFVFFFCSHWSLVDVPLIFFCPADHVPNWQPRIFMCMVEARPVNVKKTTTIGLCLTCCVTVVSSVARTIRRMCESTTTTTQRPSTSSTRAVLN